MIDLTNEKDVYTIKRVLTLLNDTDNRQFKLAVDEQYITEKELAFVRDIQEQRSINNQKLAALSEKQLNWLKSIAYRVLNQTKPQGEA
ncbi:TPA: hypothetical protein NGT37_000570 [Vibrio parahaemolyticus]|nr:hypothetical protein [Vibrio parahaemolyticus]